MRCINPLSLATGLNDQSAFTSDSSSPASMKLEQANLSPCHQSKCRPFSLPVTPQLKTGTIRSIFTEVSFLTVLEAGSPGQQHGHVLKDGLLDCRRLLSVLTWQRVRDTSLSFFLQDHRPSRIGHHSYNLI